MDDSGSTGASLSAEDLTGSASSSPLGPAVPPKSLQDHVVVLKEPTVSCMPVLQAKARSDVPPARHAACMDWAPEVPDKNSPDPHAPVLRDACEERATIGDTYQTEGLGDSWTHQGPRRNHWAGHSARRPFRARTAQG